MHRCPIAALVLGLFAAVPGAGQVPRVYVSPYVGAFIPANSLGRVVVYDISNHPVVVDGGVEASAGLGGRIAYWPKERFGLEGSYFYTKGNLKATDGHTSALFDSEVQIGSLKGLFQLTPGTTGTDFILSAGLAGVHHGGEAFGAAGPTSDFGGTIGAGLQIDISPVLRLRLDAEALGYQWRGRSDLPSTTQVDLALTAGLALRLSR